MGSCLTTAEFEMAVDIEENDVAVGQPGIGFANTQAIPKNCWFKTAVAEL